MFDFTEDEFISTLSIGEPHPRGQRRDGRTNPLAGFFDQGSDKRKHSDQPTEESYKRTRSTGFGTRTPNAFVSPPCSPPHVIGLGHGLKIALPISPLLLSQAAPDGVVHSPRPRGLVVCSGAAPKSDRPRAPRPGPF